MSLTPDADGGEAVDLRRGIARASRSAVFAYSIGFVLAAVAFDLVLSRISLLLPPSLCGGVKMGPLSMTMCCAAAGAFAAVRKVGAERDAKHIEPLLVTQISVERIYWAFQWCVWQQAAPFAVLAIASCVGCRWATEWVFYPRKIWDIDALNALCWVCWYCFTGFSALWIAPRVTWGLASCEWIQARTGLLGSALLAVMVVGAAEFVICSGLVFCFHLSMGWLFRQQWRNTEIASVSGVLLLSRWCLYRVAAHRIPRSFRTVLLGNA